MFESDHLHRLWKMNAVAFSLLLVLTFLGWGLAENGSSGDGTLGWIILAAMSVKFLLIFFVFMEMEASHMAWKLLGSSYIVAVTSIFFTFLV